MRTAYTIMICIMAVAIIAFTPPAAEAQQDRGVGKEQSEVKYLSPISLNDWQNSSSQERRAFLAGFVNMLQMEAAWQGENALSISESTVSTWMRGLSGVTIPEMETALDNYIVKRQGKLDRSVVEALGRMYVKPKLSKDERAASEKRLEALKAIYSK